MRSKFPFRVADQLDPDLVNYLVDVGKPAGSVTSVSASPTTTELAAALNALLASLQAAGKLET